MKGFGLFFPSSNITKRSCTKKFNARQIHDASLLLDHELWEKISGEIHKVSSLIFFLRWSRWLCWKQTCCQANFYFYFIFPKYIIIVKNDAFFSRDKMLKLMKKTLTNISNNNLTEIRMTIFRHNLSTIFDISWTSRISAKFSLCYVANLQDL